MGDDRYADGGLLDSEAMKIFREGGDALWHTLLLLPSQRRIIEQAVPMPPKTETGHFFGSINVIEDPHLKDGEWFLTPGPTAINYSTMLGRDAVPPPEMDVEMMLADLQRAMRRTLQEAWYYGDRPHDPEWVRRPGESLGHWEQRLVANDWLDNPEIRWAYQCAVWSSIWQGIKNRVERILRWMRFRSLSHG